MVRILFLSEGTAGEEPLDSEQGKPLLVTYVRVLTSTGPGGGFHSALQDVPIYGSNTPQTERGWRGQLVTYVMGRRPECFHDLLKQMIKILAWDQAS